MHVLAFLVAIAFGVARLLMPVESQVHKADLFKDAAHIYVGILFGIGGVGIYLRGKLNQFSSQGVFAERIARLFWVAVALTILEIVAFKLHEVEGVPLIVSTASARDPFVGATEGLTDREFEILAEVAKRNRVDRDHWTVTAFQSTMYALTHRGFLSFNPEFESYAITRRGRKELRTTPAVKITEPVPSLDPPRHEPTPAPDPIKPRSEIDRRLDDLERRLRKLEKPDDYDTVIPSGLD